MKLLSALLLTVMLLAGCGQRPQELGPGEGAGEALWGRTFSSVSVADDRSDAEPDSVTVAFEERGNRNVIRWSGCNATGSAVEITAERIRLDSGPQESTLIGCPPEEQESDRWLLRFFAGGPYWELEEDRLTLTSAGGDAEIVLEDD